MKTRTILPKISIRIFLVFFLFGIGALIPPVTKGETPAPFIHWGALSYPDQEPSLEMGLSLFRFTEFNGDGERFNGINETIGINFITLSWTEHSTNSFKNWSTNFTQGLGQRVTNPRNDSKTILFMMGSGVLSQYLFETNEKKPIFPFPVHSPAGRKSQDRNAFCI